MQQMPNETTLNRLTAGRAASLLLEARMHKNAAYTLYSDVQVALLYYDQLPSVEHKIRTIAKYSPHADTVIEKLNRQICEKMAVFCRGFKERKQQIDTQWQYLYNELITVVDQLGYVEPDKLGSAPEHIEDVKLALEETKEKSDRIDAMLLELCSQCEGGSNDA